MTKSENLNRSANTDQLIVGDARKLTTLINCRKPIVDTIITSPPYGNLIDYKVRRQLGHGQDWDSYIRDLMRIFESTYAIVKETGSLWVVVDAWRDGKSYRLLPLEIANRASALGWKLRDIIIWDKQHTLPYYAHGQFRPVYEYILFFAKGEHFKFFRDRVREIDGLSMWWVDFPERFSPLGKSPTNIWNIPIRPQGGGWRGKRQNWRHDCPFPTELAARIIELTTDPGDTVFDPFAGSGVVLATAKAMGRHYLGLELKPKFAKQFNSVVMTEVAEEYKKLLIKRQVMNGLNGSFGDLILRLRALKYARKVTNAINSQIKNSNIKGLSLQLCICVAEIPKILKQGNSLEIMLYLLYTGSAAEFKEILREVKTQLVQFPLSNYGIDPSIRAFKRKTDLQRMVAKETRLYLYPKVLIRSYHRVRQFSKWLCESPESWKVGDFVPILSNLKVDVSWMIDKYGNSILPE